MPTTRHPALKVNSDSSSHGPHSVSACCLDPDLVAFLASCTQPHEVLKSILRVSVAQAPPTEAFPDVSGRHLLLEDEVRFIPYFPFETDLKYRASFDPRPLGLPFKADSLMLEFMIPAKRNAPALTEVTHIFPSCDLLPENLLRFYVCFSNSMQRGRALAEISLLDSDGQPVADALYRPPVELWDRTMRYLTVLLDPGRLKRWVGPNSELGPPLKREQKYSLEIGSGMTDLHGHPLRKIFRKHFTVGNAVRERLSIEDWKILLPVTGSRQALALLFTNPIDWALHFHTISIESKDGLAIDGRFALDQCERRWSFTPNSPWIAGIYCIIVVSNLEDVCGNSIAGAFDRPLRNGPSLAEETTDSLLTFQLV
jgi:hypothetical protein